MQDYRITATQLRRKFFDFFGERCHVRIAQSSLVPENDPTALFISAGMQPLVPYLLGEKHAAGKRLMNVQRCFRTSDIELVGDSSHLTFLEMLGCWSLGDYFKEEMIPWSWEFLTGQSWLGIDPSRLYVTVFAGDEAVAKDDESVRLWQEQFSSSGVPSVEGERIVALGREDNWWGPVGETGPCGPDTEMFYDTGTAPCGPQCRAGCGCGKYLEIWNDVFMEFSMQADGSCQRLPRPNVDTGLGMARMLAVLNGVESVYDIDVLKPLIDCLANLSTRDHASIAVSFRIVADHVTSACHIIADGVAPANTERGYVLRRLIRRSLVHARKLGVRERALWRPLFDQLRRLYVDDYPGIDEHADHILQILTGEEEQFGRTIETGLKQFHGLVEADAVKRDRTIDGRAAFELFATYGFPLEMTRELARERGIGVDEEGFRAEFARHQELSRQGARERFAGGLADKSELAVRYHTTTHLLHAALRQVLGGHVEQRGSHITAERLRFDFSHPRKLEQEEKSRIEALVNWAIERDYSVHCAELSADEAREGGAIGLFKERYGDRVKVYAIGDFKPAPCAMRESLTFSKEICGGPHVERTGDLGRFRIVKEQSASGGVRRVRATLE